MRHCNDGNLVRVECVDDREREASCQDAAKTMCEGAGTRSPQTASGSGHGLITGNGFHFAPAIGVVSAAGFLEPKLFHPRFLDRIELIDENASQCGLFLARKGPSLLLDVIELTAHAQIIGALPCQHLNSANGSLTPIIGAYRHHSG
jgi:hypothetical protein